MATGGAGNSFNNKSVRGNSLDTRYVGGTSLDTRSVRSNSLDTRSIGSRSVGARSVGLKASGSRSVYGSDETYDFSCTRCDGKGRVSEARHYCANCNEFYCGACVEIHSEISALRTHRVLGEDARRDWGQQNALGGPGGPGCGEHVGQTLSMFCGDHDQVCCPVCVSLDHKTCEQMAYIPKLAEGIFDSQDLMVLTSDLRILHQQMQHIIQTGDDMKSNLDTSRQTALKKLAEFRQMVNKIFDKLETRIIAEMDELVQENKDIIDTVQRSCDDVVVEVDKQEKYLADNDGITELQMFYKMRDVKLEAQTIRIMAKSVPTTTEVDRFTFDVDEHLNNFLTCLERVGSLRRRCSRSRSQAPTGGSCIYRAAAVAEVTIKWKKDKRDCCIESMCQLDDGSIILADSINSNLKRLNAAYALTDHLSLPSYPYAMNKTGPQEAAVALHNNSVHFVSTKSGKLKALRSIQLGHQCCAMAYHNGKLYISEYLGKKIFVYSSTSCAHVRTIETTSSGSRLFSKIKCVQVSDAGNQLFVSDLDKGVLVLDHLYDLVTTLDFPDSNKISAMCMDPNGNLFVGSKEAGKVLQVFNRNAYVVASKPDGVKNPTSIFVDKLKSKLLVFQGDSGNTLMAFQLA